MHMSVKLNPNYKAACQSLNINIIKAVPPLILKNDRIYYKSGLKLLRTKNFTGKALIYNFTVRMYLTVKTCSSCFQATQMFAV